MSGLFEGLSGLSEAEVARQRSAGLTNEYEPVGTKSVGRIVFDNVFTVFNLVIALLALAVLWVGSWRNALFALVMLINTGVGIFQELRTKAAIERMSLTAGGRASVIRGGTAREVPRGELVLGDTALLRRGDFVVCDARVTRGGCFVNESLVTGEADTVEKRVGDALISGSYLTAGECAAVLTAVGADCFAARITLGAKKHKKAVSQIQRSVGRIISAVGFAIIPLGALMFIRQLYAAGGALSEAVVRTAASLVGMIPEGLVLLTTTVFAVSVVRLSSHGVLVQELSAVEALARADVLCLDKTGTLTEGCMKLSCVRALPGKEQKSVELALSALAVSADDDSPVFLALRARFGAAAPADYMRTAFTPFSSERKWQSASFEGRGTFVLGAAEYIFPSVPAQLAVLLDELSPFHRVLALAHCSEVKEGRISADVAPLALLCFDDALRSDAAETVSWLQEQGMELKVISGDDPRTVSRLAKRAGVAKADDYIDCSALSGDADADAHVEKTVFGRVSPEFKSCLLEALKRRGRSTAMLGDGANDVLALRAADCGIAVAAGSDAARSVANLVLVDNRFSALPAIIAEGRRSINNLERSAALYLSKTGYSLLLTLFTLLFGAAYPFVPIQLTLAGALTIGIPSFILALEPNTDRVRPGFLKKTLFRALPGSLAVFASSLYLMTAGPAAGLSGDQTASLCTFALFFGGLLLLLGISVPFTPLRRLLVGAMAGAFVAAFLLLKSFFAFAPFTKAMPGPFIVSLAVSGLVFSLSHRVSKAALRS